MASENSPPAAQRFLGRLGLLFHHLAVRRHTGSDRSQQAEEDAPVEEPNTDKTDSKDPSQKSADDAEESDDDIEESSGPPSVQKWFDDSDHEFTAHESFHGLYIRKDYRQILLQVRSDSLMVPFFNQVTFVGAEGRLPDMVDITPGSTGLQFQWAPNGDDLQLIHMQESLPSTHLAASLYNQETGGKLSGFLQVFRSLARDKSKTTSEQRENKTPVDVSISTENAKPENSAEASTTDNPESKESKGTENSSEATPGKKQKKKGKPKKKKKRKTHPKLLYVGHDSVLIDITGWMSLFSATALSFGKSPKGKGEVTQIVDVKSYPENFLIRFSAQRDADKPLKLGMNATTYYTVAFCQLPDRLMTPRAKDRRVGYFETPITIGGPRRVNEATTAICRWNLERRKHIKYYIDPEVPALYHDTIRRGVESWNVAFEKAGCGNRVLQCVAPSDVDFPEDYSRGDARYNAVYMTDSMLPVYGFGPSLKDFRTGEILVSHVLLGFSAFVGGASRHSVEVLSAEFVRPTCGCRAPLLDADHQDVLDNVLFTVIHEVGHTLGLRHNFIAQEDGNSSAMAYPDELDTSDPQSPRYGGYHLKEPGKYDIFAIKYGYTQLPGEVPGDRHPGLDLLANGQEASEATVSSTPQNPLFATDEDVDNEDPRVNVWNSSVTRCGYDKLDRALYERGHLLELVRNEQIFPEEYSGRIRASYWAVKRHVTDGIKLLGGSQLSARRTRFELCSVENAQEALRAVVDFCVGPVGRLSAEEGQYMVGVYPRSGYQVDRTYLLSTHCTTLDALLASALSPYRLARLEMQRAMWQQESQLTGNASEGGEKHQPSPLSTFDVLNGLALQHARIADGIFHPLELVANRGKALASDANLVNKTAADVVRMEASRALARHVNRLAHNDHTLAAVQIGARAFIQEVLADMSTLDKMEGLSPITRAHWAAIKEQLLRDPKDKPADANFLSFMLVGEESPPDGFPPRMSCGSVAGRPPVGLQQTLALESHQLGRVPYRRERVSRAKL